MPETNMSSFDGGVRIVDKRKNWEARVEMAVFKRPASELSTYDKLVYAILCGHANRDGNATLYVRTIAEEASCSERQVRRVLANLEVRRLLVRRPQYIAGQGQTFNIYEIYGYDAYLSGEPPCQPVMPSLTDSHPSPCLPVIPPATDKQAPHDSQAEFNNVFQQPLKNSLKENNIPPTPQGGERGNLESESPKPQNPKHDTEAKDRNRIPTPYFPETSPYMGILAAFNEILPELPQAEILTSSRAQTLNLRINEDPARQSLDWWRRFFERVRLFPWLMGNNPNNWKATFDWLIGEDGMRKVIEGGFTQATYTRQGQFQEYSREELREWQRKFTDERGVVDAKALLRDWREKTGRTH
ncbi:MAG: helix-turn-helix domain-containing protein [Synergistaceae bacterium]|nr:helix-turn-helix domain-containing protein [Synergistaceae bacterium]